MLSQNQVVKIKAALESGYVGSMDVYEYAQTTDATTHITGSGESKVLEGIPCRLSFQSKPVTEGEDAAQQVQQIKLFYSPVRTIKAGSKVVVTQNGVTTAYKSSGKEAVYDTHKEVELKLFDRWA